MPRQLNKFWAVPLLVAFVYGLFLLRSWSTVAPGNFAPSVDKALPNLRPTSPQSPISVPLDIDRAAVEQLRDEVRQLESNIAQRERFLEKRRANSNTIDTASLVNGGLNPDQWRARGHNTPAESAETVLWAGVSGEVQSMLASIELGEESTKLASTLFGRLPQDIQNRYLSPETVIASMLIDDIPLTNAKLLSVRSKDEQTSELRLVFASNLDPAKLVTLNFQKQMNDKWKLLIPPSAIKSYAAELGVPIAPLLP